MLVNKKNLCFIFILISGQFSIAQNKTWGVSVTPGFSKTKNTVSLSYPPPPGIINLKVSEPWQFVTHAEAYLYKRRQNYAVSKGLGISRYNYYDRWEYDPASTATNYIWGKRSFTFIYLSYKIGREFFVGKLIILPQVGVSYDYMIRAQYDSESKVGSIHQNLLSQLKRGNIGLCVSVKLKTKLSDKLDFQIGPYYKQLVKDYPLPSDKKLYFLGLSLDIIRRLKE